MTTPTEVQIAAAVRITRILADTIKELGEVPSGVLYAQLMGFMNLNDYNACIDFLTRAKLISVTNHLIKWEGPR